MWENLFTEGIGVLAGVLLSTIGLSVYLSKRFTSWLTKHKLRRGVLATSNMYDLLQATQHRLGARKALLIAAHNGGSFINPLHPPHITILAETYDETVEPTKEHWQNRIADKGIVNMLSALLSEKRIVTVGEKHDGAINSTMEKDGSTGLVLQFIGIMGVMLVYASFAFETEKKLSSGDIVALEDFASHVNKTY